MKRIFAFACILVLCSVCAWAANPPFCLTRQDAESSPVHSPLLVREIFRQGILLTAHDRLHLPTRDQALREPIPADITPFDMRWKFTRDNIEIALLRNGTELSSQTIPWTQTHQFGHIYREPLEASESLMRTTWPEVLQKAGYTAHPTPATHQATIPAGAMDDLSQLDIAHQFFALRATYAAIDAGNTSPVLRGILVQAYANLARLTDVLWCDDSEVFAARALLYAQQIVIDNPSSAFAYSHRAYAFALVGCPAYAMDDLATAKKLVDTQQNTDGNDLKQPEWGDVIEAFCKDDLGELSKDVNNGHEAALASLLRYFCVEFSKSDNAKVLYEQAALERSPLCGRLLDGMNLDGGLGVMRQSTHECSVLLHQSIEGISARASVPAGAIAALKRPPDAISPYSNDTAFAAALVKSDDQGAPSYCLLGRLIQEQIFSNIYSRMYFYRNMLGVDASEYVNAVMPLITEHPYRAFVQVMKSKDRDPDRFRPLAQVHIVDPMPLMFSRMQRLSKAGTGGSNPAMDAWGVLVREHDFTVPALEVYISRIYGEKDHSRTAMAHRLLGFSPYDAIARAVLIEDDFDSVERRVPRWRREDAEHPAVLAALANHYFDAGKYDLAKDALRQRITVMPDIAAFTKLAEIDLKQNDEADWLKEMNDALQQPSYGLEQPNIQVSIARHYIAEKKFKKAKPYADAAADSYAAFAMTCAIDCDEGLGDWDDAALWAQRRAERYGNSFEWYAWCQRTGHGDLKKATAAMRNDLAQMKPHAFRETLATALEFYEMQNEGAQAITMAHRIFDVSGDTWAGMHLALLLDRDGQPKAAERVLQKVRTGVTTKEAGPPRKQLVAVAGLLDDSLLASIQSGTAPEIDLQAVQDASKGALPRDQGHIDYFVGMFLQIHHEHPEEAKALWESAADIPESSSHILAALALRRGKF